MKIVINATNLGNGGGVVHIKEFLNGALKIADEKDYIVFAQQKILNLLPEHARVEKKTHPLLEKSLLHRLYFQIFFFDEFIPERAIIFSVTGDYLGKYAPVIGMSQNMLLYERRFYKKMAFSEKLRFYVNYLKQKRSFRNSAGLIFISKYSQKVINRILPFVGKQDQQIIYHGVSPSFRYSVKEQLPITDYSDERPYVINYVSTVHTYKNHPVVIQAFAELRKMGYPLFLNMLGAVINEAAGEQFKNAMETYDKDGRFLKYHGSVDHEQVAHFYEHCDAILFASSCETMPITVIESMLSGRPLACSDMGPMPEFVKGNAYYFNPEDPESIKAAIKNLILQPEQREIFATNAQVEAQKYSWDENVKQTLQFIDQIFRKYYGNMEK